MSKFIVVHSIETREDDVEIVQPYVINVNHIVLIEQEWFDCELAFSKRRDGYLRTRICVNESGYRSVSVRESASEIMSMIGTDNMPSTTLESLSESTKQFVDSNRVADDKYWDREWRDSYGDGRGGEE